MASKKMTHNTEDVTKAKPVAKAKAKAKAAAKTAPAKAAAKKAASERVQATAAVASSAKAGGTKTTSGTLKADVYDLKGNVVESLSLPREVFGTKINKALLAQAVRVYLANQRQGTSSTKTRGEVQGSTRKIYRQKGTGRARHGGVRAPIFVHGGIAFGPKPRDFSLVLPKKMKKQALFAALSGKLKDGEIKFVSGLATITPKTKEMAGVLKGLSLDGKNKKVLLVTDKDTEVITRSVRNLDGVSFTAVSRLNTYDVLNHGTVVMMKESVAGLTEGTKNA